METNRDRGSTSSQESLGSLGQGKPACPAPIGLAKPALPSAKCAAVLALPWAGNYCRRMGLLATARGGRLLQAPVGYRGPRKLPEGFREGFGCGLRKVRPQVLSNVTEVQDHKHPVVYCVCVPTPSLPPPLLCPLWCGCELCVCFGGVTWVAPPDSPGGCENQGLALAPALPEGPQQFQSILSAQRSLARFQQSFAQAPNSSSGSVIFMKETR